MADPPPDPRQDLFKYQLYLMTKLGLWEDCSSRPGRCLYRSAYGFLVVPLLVHIATVVVPFLANFEDKDVASLTEALTLVLSLTKIVTVIVKQCEIESVMGQLRGLYARTATPEGVAIVDRCERNGRVLTVAVYAGCVVCGFLFIMGPGVPALLADQDAARKLPFNVWYPFDARRHYWEAFLLQTLMVCSAISASLLDALYLGLVMNVCGQLRVLQLSLGNIRLEETTDDQEEMVDDSPGCSSGSTSVDNPRDRKPNADESDGWKEFHRSKWSLLRENPTFRKTLSTRINMKRQTKQDSERRVAACLAQLIACKHTHTDILRVAADLQKVLSPVLFIQFLVNSLVLCLVTCKLTVTNDTNSFDTKLAYVIYLVVALYQIGSYCWFGSELMYQGEQVSLAAYDTPWCRLPREYRDSLKLVMVRAQSLIRLSGAQLYSVKLETFVSLCMASASYFSVLREKLAVDSGP